MTGNETMENGMRASEYIFGWDLNGGQGFKSFKEARETFSDKPPYQSLWKINGEIYRLIQLFHRPVFDFYTEEG